jgi:hypothetical protein
MLLSGAYFKIFKKMFMMFKEIKYMMQIKDKFDNFGRELKYFFKKVFYSRAENYTRNLEFNLGLTTY